MPNLLPDSTFFLQVTNFGHNFYFHIPKTMSPTVMVDLLIGQGFLRETQARKLDLDMLAQKYWTAPSGSPQPTPDPPSLLLIPTASEVLIQNPSREQQKSKQELLTHSHHTLKGMKRKLAYDLMWLAICIEKVERLG